MRLEICGGDGGCDRGGGWKTDKRGESEGLLGEGEGGGEGRGVGWDREKSVG